MQLFVVRKCAQIIRCFVKSLSSGQLHGQRYICQVEWPLRTLSICELWHSSILTRSWLFWRTCHALCCLLLGNRYMCVFYIDCLFSYIQKTYVIYFSINTSCSLSMYLLSDFLYFWRKF